MNHIKSTTTPYSDKLQWQKSHPALTLSANLDYDDASIWEIPTLTDTMKELPFYVQEIGRTLANRNYYVEREGLPSYMLCYINSGAMKLGYHATDEILLAEDLFLIDCREAHTLSTAEGYEHLDCYFVHFDGSGPLPYLHYLQTLSDSQVCHTSQSSPIVTNMERLLHIYTQKKSSIMIELEASTILSNICLEIINEARIHAKVKIPDVIGDIRDHIAGHYDQKITLQSLSEQFHISEAYLQKQFKKYVGISPLGFLTQLRISESKKLLRQSKETIEAIAYQVGFSDASYYIQVFHHMENMTPLQYRKLWV